MFVNDDKYDNYDDYDDEDDEHITDIIVKPPDEPSPTSIYRSKYRKSVAEESTHNKYDHKTLGVMRVSLNTPDKFLKKNSGIQSKRPEVNHEHYRRPDYQHKLPAWEPVRLSKVSDKSHESSIKSISSLKNFKKDNILNVKKAYRKSSDFKKLTSSLPSTGKHQYSTSKYSGDKKIRPRYLDQTPVRTGINLKNDVKATSTDCGESNTKVSSGLVTSIQEETKSVKNTKELPKGHYVTDEERAELLYGMKRKWDELMRQFQALPFLSDTPPKAARKSKMEENLKQLEKDIDTIERHPYIYVNDNIKKG